MTEKTRETTDHRRAIAERNVEAILDATEALLVRGDAPSTTAVATEAGVSRVTVYAHFPTHEALLEAVVERAVTKFAAALSGVDLRRGDPVQTLEQLIELAWNELSRHEAVVNAVVSQLTPGAMERSHRALHEPLNKFIHRGQAAGAFRDDLPPEWLLSSYFALMHAYRDGVADGRLRPAEAVTTLQRTLTRLFATGR